MDAAGAQGRSARGSVRRSRVVPTPRCWCQAREELRATATTKPGTPRRARN